LISIDVSQKLWADALLTQERNYQPPTWVEFEAGGHFAAMEKPELLAGDIRSFFKTVDKKGLNHD